MASEKTTEPTFDEWVILELMGHRKLAGRLREVKIAGEGMLRLDVPGEADASKATQYYSPKAVYCITPCTEELARAYAKRCDPAPVHRFELPAAPRRAGQSEVIEEDMPDEGGDDGHG